MPAALADSHLPGCRGHFDFPGFENLPNQLRNRQEEPEHWLNKPANGYPVEKGLPLLLFELLFLDDLNVHVFGSTFWAIHSFPPQVDDVRDILSSNILSLGKGHDKVSYRDHRTLM